MGAGSIDRLIPALLRRMQREEHLILICGSNQKLEQRMRARFGRDARVTILGSVSNMPVYLHACDIIYTKPGGLHLHGGRSDGDFHCPHKADTGM